jgi:hypothetical protein
MVALRVAVRGPVMFPIVTRRFSMIAVADCWSGDTFLATTTLS